MLKRAICTPTGMGLALGLPEADLRLDKLVLPLAPALAAAEGREKAREKTREAERQAKAAAKATARTSDKEATPCA